MTVHLTPAETRLLAAALSKAAARHETEARSLHPSSRFCRRHDAVAAAMRALRSRLMQEVGQNVP